MSCCLQCGEFYIANCKCHPEPCNYCILLSKERAWKITHTTLIKMLDEVNKELRRWCTGKVVSRKEHLLKGELQAQRQAYAELQLYVDRLEEWIHVAHTDIGQWVSLACWQRREIEDPDRVHYCPHQRGIDKSKKIWSNYPIRRDRK